MTGKLNKVLCLLTVYSAKVETTIKDFLSSCAISCFEISCDFVVRMMTRQNRKLNETYLRSMLDWDSAESSYSLVEFLVTSRTHLIL